MISYTELHKKKPFNWRDFFTKVNSFKLTMQDMKEAKQNASNWLMCAVGEQTIEIHRHKNTGIPIDANLMQLGIRFFKEIENSHYFTAHKTYKEIERVSAKIILDEQKNKEVQNCN